MVKEKTPTARWTCFMCMHLHSCMYTCMCVTTYEYMHVHIRTYMYMYTGKHTSWRCIPREYKLRMHTHTHTRTYIHAEHATYIFGTFDTKCACICMNTYMYSALHISWTQSVAACLVRLQTRYGASLSRLSPLCSHVRKNQETQGNVCVLSASIWLHSEIWSTAETQKDRHAQA